MTKINDYSNYYKLTAENDKEWNAMKLVKSSYLIRFDETTKSATVQSHRNVNDFENQVKHSLNETKPVIETVNKTTNRLAVEAGTVKIGDIVLGKTVTGLGKYFTPNNEDFYSVNNINPSVDYVQYVYFN